MRYFFIFLLTIMGCGAMNVGDYYHENVQKKYQEDVERKYKLIKFEDGISVSEAEILFQKYVLDNGWPWEFSGGNTKPIDDGERWIIKYMDSFGIANEKIDIVSIDKKTGQVGIIKNK